MKEQDKNKILETLIQAGLSRDETIAVLCVIKQGNRPLKPSYNIKLSDL